MSKTFHLYLTRCTVRISNEVFTIQIRSNSVASHERNVVADLFRTLIVL
jgi:hypothetical protein